MNKNILFFSVNRHQKSYFDSLLSVMQQKGNGVSLHKRSLRWSLPSFSVEKSHLFLAYKVSLIRLSYFYNKTGKTKALLRDSLLLPFYIMETLLFLLRVKNLLNKQHFDIVILWNDMKWHQYIIKHISKSRNIKTAFFENGALPNTVTLDSKGVNFNNSIPRKKDFYLKGSNLIDGKENKQVLSEGYIFVPFQVDYDSQIICHSPWVKNMEELYYILERTLLTLPESVRVIVKEHPKSFRNYDYLHNKNPRIIFKNSADTNELIASSKIVMTVNSTVGLESIIKDKSVIVLGNAFYAVDGLCRAVKGEKELAVELRSVISPSIAMKESFLEYLTEYYIAGDWKEPSEDHMERVVKRILSFVENNHV